MRERRQHAARPLRMVVDLVSHRPNRQRHTPIVTLRTIIRRLVGERSYARLRVLKNTIQNLTFAARRASSGVVGQPRLSMIGKHCGTDKVAADHTVNGLSYLDIYEPYFAELRGEPISLLEIGVREGASLRTWKEYFAKAKVFGIDIDPECKRLQEDRIAIEIGSQDDVEFLRQCFGTTQKFDIIIDDGSHINSMMIASFDCLFNERLASGGMYILEDLKCSYKKLQTTMNVLETWPGMRHDDPGKTYDNDREDMDRFFSSKIKLLDHAQGNIRTIHFWPMICIITRV